MMLPLAVRLGGLAIIWLIAIMQSQTRNRRALLVLAGLSVVVLLGASVAGPVGRIAAATAGIGTAFVLIWPQRLNLASLTSRDVAADRLIRDADAALDGLPSPEGVIRLTTHLQAPPFTTSSDPWSTVARFYRVMLSRVSDLDDSATPVLTANVAYRRAGRHYWRLVRERAVVGRSHLPTAWDENVLLQTYIEEFNRLVTRSADQGRPGDGWLHEMEDRIEELTNLELHHPGPRANRALAIASMQAVRVVVIGDRSSSANECAAAAATAMTEGWQVAPE